MLKKRYMKSRKVCKVTFDLPEAELPEAVEAESVYLVGEFNDWDPTATPMTRRKGGVFRVTLELRDCRLACWSSSTSKSAAGANQATFPEAQKYCHTGASGKANSASPGWETLGLALV